MALPALTAEARAEALKKAVAVRKERGELMAALKAGDLPLVTLLAREDAVVGKIRVRRLLESLPGIGSVRAGQLLASLGISETRRVQGLGPPSAPGSSRSSRPRTDRRAPLSAY